MPWLYLPLEISLSTVPSTQTVQIAPDMMGKETKPAALSLRTWHVAAGPLCLVDCCEPSAKPWEAKRHSAGGTPACPRTQAGTPQALQVPGVL